MRFEFGNRLPLKWLPNVVADSGGLSSSIFVFSVTVNSSCVSGIEIITYLVTSSVTRQHRRGSIGYASEFLDNKSDNYITLVVSSVCVKCLSQLSKLVTIFHNGMIVYHRMGLKRIISQDTVRYTFGIRLVLVQKLSWLRQEMLRELSDVG